MSVVLEENKAKAAKFQKECEDYLVVLVGQKREADEQAKVKIISLTNYTRFLYLLKTPISQLCLK